MMLSLKIILLPLARIFSPGRMLFKIRQVDLLRYPECCIDQTHMTIGLRVISPLRSVEANIFAKDSQMVGKGKDSIKSFSRVINTADTCKGINIPECAH